MKNEWGKVKALAVEKCTQDGTENNEMKAPPETEVFLYMK